LYKYHHIAAHIPNCTFPNSISGSCVLFFLVVRFPSINQYSFNKSCQTQLKTAKIVFLQFRIAGWVDFDPLPCWWNPVRSLSISNSARYRRFSLCHSVIPLRQVWKAILSLGCRPNGEVTLGPTTTTAPEAPTMWSARGQWTRSFLITCTDVHVTLKLQTRWKVFRFFQDRDETLCLRDRNHFETLSTGILKIKLLPSTPI